MVYNDDMTIYLATDHAGFELKEKIKKILIEQCYDVIDCGPDHVDKDDDYPDFISKAARLVAKKPESRGIIFGGSGQGEAMVANRVTGVRATVWYGGSMDIIKLSRDHNDANMLSIGARFVTEPEMLEAIKLWLATPFSNAERHLRRINKF